MAKDVFSEVDDALGEKLSALMFQGDIEELTLTKNAQPAIMAFSIAILRVMSSNGLDLKTIDLLAGHSLGEYSALVRLRGNFSKGYCHSIKKKRYSYAKSGL